MQLSIFTDDSECHRTQYPFGCLWGICCSHLVMISSMSSSKIAWPQILVKYNRKAKIPTTYTKYQKQAQH
jgi:hypothetical protein